jgi:hypothetical protein
MRKQMIENAAYDVATQVRAVEDSIDLALAELGELQGKMVRVRSVAGVSAGTGHDAFEKLAGALTALVGARGSMVGCHAALVDAKAQVPGLRTVAFGDEGDCPEITRTDLRIVA